MSAVKTSTEVLQDAFPGRVSISPKEAAKAIHGEGKDTKKRVEGIRDQLENGTLIPGLRKSGARWSIPIAALGAAMDERRRREEAEQSRASGHVPSAAGPRTRRSSIGPRLYFQTARSKDVWTQILWELDALEADDQAKALDAATPAPPRQIGRGGRGL